MNEYHIEFENFEGKISDINSFNDFLFVMINVKNEFVIQVFDIQNSIEYNEETQNPKANKIKELRI